MDHETGYTTTRTLQHRLVTSLQYSFYEFGDPIIRKGQLPQGIVFIEKNGLTVLGCQEQIRLLDFYESSFVGEFETIFRVVAERSYIAVNKDEIPKMNTNVYIVNADTFNELLLDYSDFDKFCRTRAIRRRAYIRFRDREIMQELEGSDPFQDSFHTDPDSEDDQGKGLNLARKQLSTSQTTLNQLANEKQSIKKIYYRVVKKLDPTHICD